MSMRAGPAEGRWEGLLKFDRVRNHRCVSSTSGCGSHESATKKSPLSPGEEGGAFATFMPGSEGQLVISSIPQAQLPGSVET